MKHLVINNYGTFLGVKSGMLLVRNVEKEQRIYPLNRLNSISIAKRGVSISSDLIELLSNRGIKLFFLNFKGTTQATLIGNVQHGVVAARKEQHSFCNGDTVPLAQKIIAAKIKNQRAVLNYFGKYHKNSALLSAADDLKLYAQQCTKVKTLNELLGYEGTSARTYFQALKEAQLFSATFVKREGRGSEEVNNSMLNFGYAILSSYILGAIENAGLEPYVGVMHAVRPGKMSLVYDIMEEYRAWVVDRAVLKLRALSESEKKMTQKLKGALVKEVQRTCSKSYPYRGKSVKLEHIIQRQVYRLSGHFCGDKKYRPYLFKW